MNQQQVDITVDEARSKRRDITLDQARDYDYVQPKYDGWWVLVVVSKSGECCIYSSGGRLLRTIMIPPQSHEMIFQGEYMYGTNWSQSHNLGSIILFDMFEKSGVDEPYYSRLRRLEHWVRSLTFVHPFRIIETYPIDALDWTWNTYIVHQDYEGLVFKNRYDSWGAEIARHKKVITQDYVCMGFNEGSGRLVGMVGSIIGGAYIDGVLQEITSVSGLDDGERADMWKHRRKNTGRVFEATGKILFPETGALRHGSFNRWRDDKQPKECTWQPKSKM